MYDMTPYNYEVCNLSGLVTEQVVTILPRNYLLPAKENMSVCDAYTFRTISLRPRISCIVKLKPIEMDDQSTFLNRYLNVEDEYLPFVNMLKTFLTKSRDKATHEKDHKGNDNIDDVDNDCASSIHMNKEVHDGSDTVNKDVTKDTNISNMSFLYKDIMLKWNFLAPKRMLPKEAY